MTDGQCVNEVTKCKRIGCICQDAPSPLKRAARPPPRSRTHGAPPPQADGGQTLPARRWAEASGASRERFWKQRVGLSWRWVPLAGFRTFLKNSQFDPAKWGFVAGFRTFLNAISPFGAICGRISQFSERICSFGFRKVLYPATKREFFGLKWRRRASARRARGARAMARSSGRISC